MVVFSNYEKAGGDALSRESIIRKDEKLNYVLGIVYEPGVVDLQGDYMEEDEIRKMAWRYLKMLQSPSEEEQFVQSLMEALEETDKVYLDTEVLRESQNSLEKSLGDMHDDQGNHIGAVVESWIAPADLNLAGHEIKKGSWLLGAELSDTYYQKVLDGEWTGWSMGGYARSAVEEVM